MAVGSWRFVLTDTNFVPVGEVINASERSVTLGLSRIDAASFKIRLDNPLADPLRFLSGYLKAYRDGTLMFYGPLVGAEETVNDDGAYVTVNAAGVGWFLNKRLAGKRQDSPGYQTWTATDRATIIGQYISDILDIEFKPFLAPLNPRDIRDFRLYGNTYIDVATLPMTSASAITYTVPPYKPFMELVNELSAGLGGFEWRIMPRENWVAGAVSGIKIGNMTSAPVLGQSRPGAVFEFGIGRTNITGYTRSLNREGQANRVYHLLSTGPLEPNPAQTPPVTQDSVTSATLADWGIMEDIAQADLVDRTMRQQLVDEHGRVRQTPRSTIVFTPAADYGDGRMPEFGVEYDVGDTVRARARYGGIDRFNAAFRVWGVQFNINEFGVETPVLTLSEEGAV